ncbi:MAG: ribonuclease E inhibitor RraB [Polyangiaceae bacterium]
MSCSTTSTCQGERTLRRVASGFAQSGFATRNVVAQMVNWLVLTRHRIAPSLEVIVAARASMREIVDQYAGEYDGWEADLKGEP